MALLSMPSFVCSQGFSTRFVCRYDEQAIRPGVSNIYNTQVAPSRGLSDGCPRSFAGGPILPGLVSTSSTSCSSTPCPYI